MTLPVPPPVSPMLAKLARELPDGGHVALRAEVGRVPRASCSATATTSSSAAATRSRSRGTSRSSSTRCARRCPSGAVVDGEIVIATDHGLDFDMLSLRIHPAESRVDDARRGVRRRRSSRSTCSPRATTTCARVPFRERRARLERAARRRDATGPPHAGHAPTRRVAEQWFERFEGAGLDGVVAKPLDGEYLEGKRTMLKVKHLRTADCVVAGYREHKDGEGVGSLLLGLYDDDGRAPPRRCREQLRGAAARRARRGARAATRDDAMDDHPWREWAEAPRSERAPGSACRVPGAAGTRSKDLSWDAAAHRARRRGRVRAPPGRPLPPHRPLPALASRPRARVVHLRAARVARPGRAARGVRRLRPSAPTSLDAPSPAMFHGGL